MNFNNLKQRTGVAHQNILGLCALAAIMILPSCGGSNSTTVLENDLPSPVAGGIKGEVLQPAPVGKEPVPVAELAALPIINLNQRQFADPNVLLNLNATVTVAPGATLAATLWTQVTGPAVRIPSPLQLNNEIIIPDVAVATTLEFRLTAQDSKGKINSATVSILVKPVPAFVKVIGGVFNEADKVAVFTLKLNAANSLPITVAYTTQDGSAINGSDYVLTSGQIIFAAGEISKTLSVPLIDDTLTENDETFSLQISAVDGATAFHNRGIAIIHSGSELALPQTIQFTLPTPASIKLHTQYTNPLATTLGTGAVIYTSSNPQIASVDANGVVTGLTLGTVTITATKAADSVYAAAETSYQLQITNPGSAPAVTIDGGGNITVAKGQNLLLHASAVDLEDGPLPDSAIDQSRFWNSNIGGLLGYGTSLTFNASTPGLHAINHFAIDSDGNMGGTGIDVFVGNLTPQAAATEVFIPPASTSTTISAACISTASAVNDSNRGTSFTRACGESSVIYLRWPSQITFDLMEVYLTLAPSQSNQFMIEALDSGREAWVNVPYHEEVFPEFNYRTLGFDSQGITTNQLRISQASPEVIAEIAIYRVFEGMPAETPSSASSSAKSAAVASSSVISSSVVRSSSISSSTISSSLASSSKASSSRASSSVVSSSIARSSTLSSSKASSSIASTRVNIAPLASTKASSTYCNGSDCYSTSKINDGDLSTVLGAMHSWVNDDIAGERWVSLTWPRPVTITQVDLYTSQGGIIQDYDIEYFAGGESWIRVNGLSKNTSLSIAHSIPNITTTQLRVVVRNGSVTQPIFGRINELVVFGTLSTATSSASNSSISGP